MSTYTQKAIHNTLDAEPFNKEWAQAIAVHEARGNAIEQGQRSAQVDAEIYGAKDGEVGVAPNPVPSEQLKRYRRIYAENYLPAYRPVYHMAYIEAYPAVYMTEYNRAVELTNREAKREGKTAAEIVAGLDYA